MNKEQAHKAMMNGHKVAHIYFTDDEYLHIKDGVITSEDGCNFEDWFSRINPDSEWKLDNWFIVKICYECGKRIYPDDEHTLDDLNYAHANCIGAKK